MQFAADFPLNVVSGKTQTTLKLRMYKNNIAGGGEWEQFNYAPPDTVWVISGGGLDSRVRYNDYWK